MCGIAGLWFSDARPTDAEQQLDSMLGCMEHRGPDDAGVWIDRSANVILGHRRLAVIDLSPLAHQPMISEDRQVGVVFNGEIYNFTELRRELLAAGCRFSSDSDTEVLLHGYRTWGGERLLDRLVGMFAFAVWDGTSETLFLARDRAGEKPLYYTRSAWGFAFASEVSALATLPGVATDIDRDALALYLHYQSVPAPYSIYRAVRKLPPGHAMRVRRDGAHVWRYWDPVALATGPRLRIDEPEALTQLDGLLRTAVRGQMIADVPLGAFLSGGIDSTAVVAAMVELSSSPVKTFTIGFDVARFDESAHAGAVAAHLGTDHTVEMLTEREALAIIPSIPGMYGEPFADSSALPTYLVSRTARRHVTVSLSGDGGDEAFGGYPRYDYLELGAHLTRVLGPAGKLLVPVLSKFPGKLRRGAPLLALPLPEIYRRLLTIFGPDEVRALTGRLPDLDAFDSAWQAASRQTVRRRAMLVDLLTYLPDAILTKVDRAAMAVSLETRAPLLDHRILEFALQLPRALVHRKRLLRHWVYRRVPRALVDRPKQGFGVPLARWFRGALRPALLDVLTPARLQTVGVTEYSLVKRLIDEHLSGAADHSSRLWALLVLGLWSDTRATQRRSRIQPEFVRRGRAEVSSAEPRY